MNNKTLEYLKIFLTFLTLALLTYFWEWVKVSNAKEMGLFP